MIHANSANRQGAAQVRHPNRRPNHPNRAGKQRQKPKRPEEQR
jgi:hypothetical protein